MRFTTVQKAKLFAVIALGALSVYSFSGHHKASHEMKHSGTQHSATAHQMNHSKVSMEMIKKAQAALNDMGYPVADVDGIVGPKTANAIRDFQTARDLEVTGNLNEETVTELNLESDWNALNENMNQEYSE